MMRKVLFLLLFIPLLLANTCSDDDNHEIPCTAEARAGLNVSVSLGSMNSITSEGVTVIANDGDYSETLTAPIESDPVFSGAYERSGNYTITVSKEGYHTYTSETIAM